MDPMPYVGTCKVCKYGMLEIHYNFKSNSYLVMCDECLAEWENPENALSNKNGCRKTYTEAEARIAGVEEIIEIGWGKYIIR